MRGHSQHGVGIGVGIDECPGQCRLDTEGIAVYGTPDAAHCLCQDEGRGHDVGKLSQLRAGHPGIYHRGERASQYGTEYGEAHPELQYLCRVISVERHVVYDVYKPGPDDTADDGPGGEAEDDVSLHGGPPGPPQRCHDADHDGEDNHYAMPPDGHGTYVEEVGVDPYMYHGLRFNLRAFYRNVPWMSSEWKIMESEFIFIAAIFRRLC